MTQIDHENVQATAAKVIFDLFHLYGLEAFRPQIHSEGEGQGEKHLRRSAVSLSQLVPGESSSDGMEIASGEVETGNGEVETASGEKDQTDTGEKSNDPDEATQQILHLLAGYLDKEVTYSACHNGKELQDLAQTQYYLSNGDCSLSCRVLF